MKTIHLRRGLSRRSLVARGAAGIATIGAGTLAAPAILAQQPRAIRMGYVMGAGGAADKAAGDFAKIVAERSKGALVVQNFPGGQLGGERDMVESVQLGSIQIGFFGSYLIGNIVPEWGQVLDLPYLIRDQAHFRKIVDGPLAKPMYDALLQRKGLRHVAWCNRGPRYLTTNRAVSAPADVRGLKLRVPELETYVAAWRALGATVTPMALPEVFLALKQGIIDGQENPLELIFTNSFFEAQKFVNLTGHIRSGYEVVVSERWFNGLPADQKAIVTEGLVEMCRLEDRYQAEDESVLEQKLKAGGMTFNPVDLEKFRAALADLPKQFERKWVAGFYDAVRNA
jgi:tripartite ATP-independent transporter DctP family solute receptor